MEVIVGDQSSNTYAWRKDPPQVLEARRKDDGPLDEFPTNGGTVVVFEGKHFGGNASVTDDKGRIAVEATYTTRDEADAPEYTARDCAVTERYRRIECTTVEGLGARQWWTVHIDGAIVSSAAVTSYGAPRIERVDVVGTWKPHAGTAGGDLLRLYGRNFGPRDVASPIVRYGAGDTFDARWYEAASCKVLGHQTLECKRLAPGVGAALRVHVSRIGARGCRPSTQCRASPVATADASLISYRAPLVTGLEGRGGGPLPDLRTTGGDEIVLRGSFFGPAGGDVVVSEGVRSRTLESCQA